MGAEVKQRDLAYVVLHENAGVAITYHPVRYPRVYTIEDFLAEEGSRRHLDVVSPCEPHKVRPRGSTSNRRLWLSGREISFGTSFHIQGRGGGEGQYVFFFFFFGDTDRGFTDRKFLLTLGNWGFSRATVARAARVAAAGVRPVGAGLLATREKRSARRKPETVVWLKIFIL